jgi:hypothetical protein
MLVWVLGTTLLFVLMWRFVYPNLYLKRIEKDLVQNDHFCKIDIRDFISSHRAPMNDAENIPLSYLPRTLKEKTPCDKDVVIIAENQKAARIAARMLKKQVKKQLYYYTV